MCSTVDGVAHRPLVVQRLDGLTKRLTSGHLMDLWRNPDQEGLVAGSRQAVVVMKSLSRLLL